MKLEFSIAADIGLVVRPAQPISSPVPAVSRAVIASTPLRDQGS